jgi:biopolymer transport protein ExbB
MHDFSVTSMFLGASAPVKLVMVILAIASILSWTVALAKAVELTLAGRYLRRTLRLLDGARRLEEATSLLAGDRGVAARMVASANLELAQGAPNGGDGVRERAGTRFERLEAHEARRRSSGIGSLAIIGTTSPFIGLFGTVWGIMNAFIDIARASTTNLSVVAPGIAEALLTTAAGLVAAIPAVIGYNLFARMLSGNRVAVGDIAASVFRLLSRELDGVGSTASTATPKLHRAAE